MHETHGRLVAIMFVRINEPCENDRGAPVIAFLTAEDKQLICAHVKSFHGAVVDIRAGELFAHFPGAVVAFNAAMSLHQRMQHYNLRIGLHLGEVPYRKGRFQGADVNFASRLPGCARAGGICLSQTVFQYLRETDQRKLVALGRQELKHFSRPMPLFASLPAGQAHRSKTREWKRQLYFVLRKYHRYALLMCLTSVFSILVWSHFNEYSLKKRAVTHLFLPGFEQQQLHRQENRVRNSIEMTLRSRLSQLNDLHLTAVRSTAPYELLLTFDHSKGRIRIVYFLNNLLNDMLIGKGVIEGDEQELFSIQDQLSEEVVSVMRQHKIIVSPVASFFVRAKLVDR